MDLESTKPFKTCLRLPTLGSDLSDRKMLYFDCRCKEMPLGLHASGKDAHETSWVFLSRCSRWSRNPLLSFCSTLPCVVIITQLIKAGLSLQFKRSSQNKRGQRGHGQFLSQGLDLELENISAQSHVATQIQRMVGNRVSSQEVRA